MIKKRSKKVFRNSGRNTKQKKVYLKYFFYTTLIILILGVLCTARVIFGEGDWLSKSKLVLVQPTVNRGDVHIIILDKANREITSILMPSSVEVEVAGNLGKRRVGNLWELGLDENKGGELLQRTIQANFFFPVEAWVSPDVDILNFGFQDKILFILGKGMSSVGMKDRIRIAFFLTSLTGKHAETKLSESPLIKSAELFDGSMGYAISGMFSDKIFSYFFDQYLSESSYKVMIKRSHQTVEQAEMFGRVIETWGIKPAYAISEQSPKLLESCVIYTNSIYLAKKVRNTFGCKVVLKNSDIFDAEIIIGDLISENY